MAVTVDDVRARYRDLLHVDPADEPGYVAGMAQVAIDKAIADVAGIFGGNGFTPAQITAWPGYNATVVIQALFWVLTLGGVLDSPGNQRAIKTLIAELDQRVTLATMYPDDDGLPIIPGKILSGVGFGPSKIIGPDGKGSVGEPFRDDRTGTWRRM